MTCTGVMQWHGPIFMMYNDKAMTPVLIELLRTTPDWVLQGAEGPRDTCVRRQQPSRPTTSIVKDGMQTDMSPSQRH